MRSKERRRLFPQLVRHLVWHHARSIGGPPLNPLALANAEDAADVADAEADQPRPTQGSFVPRARPRPARVLGSLAGSAHAAHCTTQPAARPRGRPPPRTRRWRRSRRDARRRRASRWRIPRPRRWARWRLGRAWAWPWPARLHRRRVLLRIPL